MQNMSYYYPSSMGMSQSPEISDSTGSLANRFNGLNITGHQTHLDYQSKREPFVRLSKDFEAVLTELESHTEVLKKAVSKISPSGNEEDKLVWSIRTKYAKYLQDLINNIEDRYKSISWMIRSTEDLSNSWSEKAEDQNINQMQNGCNIENIQWGSYPVTLKESNEKGFISMSEEEEDWLVVEAPEADLFNDAAKGFKL